MDAKAAPSALQRRQLGSLALSILTLATLLLQSACIVGEEKCDANQVYVDQGADYCACKPGTILDPRGYGCIACGPNQEVMGAQCVCSAGFARTAPTAPCEPVVGQVIGAACTGDGTCTQPYPYCATDGAERYCTKQGCTATDCPSGYSCETVSGASFCAKLPTGLGSMCNAPADCAAFEASQCDVVNRQCVVGNCATKVNKCPSSYGCCDLSMFAPGVSACFAPAALAMRGGMCPIGMLVTP